MSFVNWKVKENTQKCTDCKMNFASYKINQSGYMHYMNLDDKVQKLARATMWASCKVCSVRKDFEKVYGVEPIQYFSTAR